LTTSTHSIKYKSTSPPKENNDLLFAELEGKDVTELMAAGRERLAYAPCSRAVGVGSTAPAGAVGVEAKEEEKEDEKVEEEDKEGMGLSLFDG
jgi:large subunit ribosomal protein LP2